MVRHTRVSDVISALTQPKRSKLRNPALAKRRRNRVAAIETLQSRQLLAVVAGASTPEPIATSPVAAQEASVAAIAATTAQTETMSIAGLPALSVDAALTESTTDEYLHSETDMDITQDVSPQEQSILDAAARERANLTATAEQQIRQIELIGAEEQGAVDAVYKRDVAVAHESAQSQIKAASREYSKTMQEARAAKSKRLDAANTSYSRSRHMAIMGANGQIAVEQTRLRSYIRHLNRTAVRDVAAANDSAAAEIANAENQREASISQARRRSKRELNELSSSQRKLKRFVQPIVNRRIAAIDRINARVDSRIAAIHDNLRSTTASITVQRDRDIVTRKNLYTTNVTKIEKLRDARIEAATEARRSARKRASLLYSRTAMAAHRELASIRSNAETQRSEATETAANVAQAEMAKIAQSVEAKTNAVRDQLAKDLQELDESTRRQLAELSQDGAAPTV